MSETVTLTDEQREWRKNMLQGLDALGASIEAINGPYRETCEAFRKLKEVSDLAIDDEDFGPCASCGEPIWLIADDGNCASNDDGDRFCMRCVNEWQAEEVEAAQVSRLPGGTTEQVGS